MKQKLKIKLPNSLFAIFVWLQKKFVKLHIFLIHIGLLHMNLVKYTFLGAILHIEKIWGKQPCIKCIYRNVLLSKVSSVFIEMSYFLGYRVYL
jgi:hypothetical protein